MRSTSAGPIRASSSALCRAPAAPRPPAPAPSCGRHPPTRPRPAARPAVSPARQRIVEALKDQDRPPSPRTYPPIGAERATGERIHARSALNPPKVTRHRLSAPPRARGGPRPSAGVQSEPDRQRAEAHADEVVTTGPPTRRARATSLPAAHGLLGEEPSRRTIERPAAPAGVEFLALQHAPVLLPK